MRRLLLIGAGLALALPTPAAAARFALGVAPGHSAERVAARVEATTRKPVTIVGPFAVTVQAPTARGLAAIRGVTYVERLRAERLLSFTPNDPFVGRQWYLNKVRAFDAWPRLPFLTPARVAIIDSGVDAGHPDLKGRIDDGRSFILGSSWRTDSNGHGTFVAGQVAAGVNNGIGIAGLAVEARLLIAKVVRRDGTISPEAEASAIRWAVDRGADVINLSFGGVRDENDPGRDTYSALEAAAVEYAVRNDVLVVAAVGNGDKAPWSPWEFANYPAALPHVLGVSAVARDGSVPDFSNRDPDFNDIAAPGEAIFSTVPRANAVRTTCGVVGYSDCGLPIFRRGDGTSFSAPLISAAAAVILGERPGLRAEQTAAILQRSAEDANGTRGCRRCTPGHDEYTGWGVLNVKAAVDSLSEAAPPQDWREPNDDAGLRARWVWGRRHRIAATLDFWNDPVDVYKIRLFRGQRLRVAMRGLRSAESRLGLWRPGAKRLPQFADNSRHLAARDDEGPRVINHVVRRTGDYFLEVRLESEIPLTRYELTLFKSRRAARRPGRTGSGAPGSRRPPSAPRRR